VNADQDLVLIVEDDPDDQALLTRAFRKAKVNMPLRFANDGEEAITFLTGLPERERPGTRLVVVLLDLKLPRRSGFEVLDWMKRHEALRRVPVVILTSSGENSDMERAYDLGANSYLLKPTHPDALLRMVAQIDAYWLGLNESPARQRSAP
jgi:two-component system response regulator